MVTIQKYVKAQSLEEAYRLNQNRRNRILGGTLWLRLSNGSIGTAIDLCDLGLDKIEETEQEISIGASVTLREIELHAGLNAYTQFAVRDAVCDIVGVQFRNMATVGGSIWGRFGFSDVLTVFLAMDCEVELYPSGKIPLREFVNQKKTNDILVRLIVKKTAASFAYLSMRNQKTDFPVLACAVARVNGEVRAAVGARPMKARLVLDDKRLLSEKADAESAAAFADYVADTVPMGSNTRGSAEYRTHLARVLVKRAVLRLKGEENGN